MGVRCLLEVVVRRTMETALGAGCAAKGGVGGCAGDVGGVDAVGEGEEEGVGGEGVVVMVDLVGLALLYI